MARAIATLITMFLLCGSAVPADQLVFREVNQKNPGGKDLNMVFREVSREEKTSLAKVTRRSGASVHSSMFVVRGFYDIAKARGAKYFINLREWDGPDGDRMYLVGIANDRNVSIPQYFGLNEAPSVPERREFLSVEQFAPMFEGGR
jgi:hypothetical protein